MTYTTLQQLTERFGEATLIQLTDRAVPPAGAIDADVVARALADADATIDASLAVRYRLPLASVPAVIADLARTIAIYKLHVFAPDPKIERDYEQALKDLRDIADGRKKLDVAGLEPPTSGASGVVATDRPRDFSPESLAGFI